MKLCNVTMKKISFCTNSCTELLDIIHSTVVHKDTEYERLKEHCDSRVISNGTLKALIEVLKKSGRKYKKHQRHK